MRVVYAVVPLRVVTDGDGISPFRSEALLEQRVFEEEEATLSEPASFAPVMIIVAFVAVVATMIVGLNRHVELIAVGPAVVDGKGGLLAAVPSKYRNLIVPGQRAEFEGEGAGKHGVFVTVGLQEGPSGLLIVRAIPAAGAPVRHRSQYGRALIRLGTEPVLGKFVPVLESILVPDL